MPENTNVADEREMPLLLDPVRACRELGGISERTLFNLIRNRKLERVKLGRLVRVTSESVRKLAGTGE